MSVTQGSYFFNKQDNNVEYEKEAAELCRRYEFSEIRKVLEERSLHLTEAHFKILENAMNSNIRNNSMKENVPIQVCVRLGMSTGIAAHITAVCKKT